MHWLWFALICVISISVAGIFQKLAMKQKESNPIASSILFQFLLFSITLAFALTRGLILPPLSLVPYYFGSGLLYAVGTLAFFTALKYIDISETAVLGGFGAVVTIAVSFLFLHESLTLIQLLGAFLVITAIVIVHYSKSTFHFNSGAWHALLGTSTYGVAVVIDSYIIKHYNAVSFLPFASITPGLILLVRYMKHVPSLVRAMRHINRNLIIFTLLYAIQAIAFYVSLERGAIVAQVSSISRASIILTVILAMIFLKERSHPWKKLLSAILTTIGIFLIK